jgi:hypothetical protein
MPVCGHKTAPDLVALRDDGHIAVIECKRATSGQAKKGMFEQVLMYAEILLPLLLAEDCSGFVEQCQRATPDPSGNAQFDLFITALSARTPEIQHNARRYLHLWLVVDRWSGRMDVTARYTWEFMNQALQHRQREPTRVWATGELTEPVDVAEQRARWLTTNSQPARAGRQHE